MHVHSGETIHHSSTSTKTIENWITCNEGNKLIFTTYHSLNKLISPNINIDLIHFDEAHNSIRNDFYPVVEQISANTDRCYYYTATLKYREDMNNNSAGMNNTEVYGGIISSVSAKSMVEEGHIVPAIVETKVIADVRNSKDINFAAERDCNTLLDIILNEEHTQKVLIPVPTTKIMIRMLAETEFLSEMNSHDYSVCWITAKYGAFIDNQKVSREKFFNTISEWGADPDKKFVILHHSILSEGINVSGLTACVMMRNMDCIAALQTIGRLLRLDKRDAENLKNGSITPDQKDKFVKPFGVVYVPVYENNHGKKTRDDVAGLVNTVFDEGKTVIKYI
jgi:superfamily II DNA or RNA helicase